MRRSGRNDADKTLIPVFIKSLYSQLQEMIYISRLTEVTARSESDSLSTPSIEHELKVQLHSTQEEIGTLKTPEQVQEMELDSIIKMEIQEVVAVRLMVTQNQSSSLLVVALGTVKAVPIPKMRNHQRRYILSVGSQDVRQVTNAKRIRSLSRQATSKWNPMTVEASLSG